MIGGRQIVRAVKIKGRHRVVPSGGPVDSDEEVHPDGEALLPVVFILVGTPGALQADFVLDDWPKGLFCEEICLFALHKGHYGLAKVIRYIKLVKVCIELATDPSISLHH